MAREANLPSAPVRTVRLEPQAGPLPDAATLAPKPLVSAPPRPAAPPSPASLFSSVAFEIGGLPAKARWAAVSAEALDTSCETGCPAATDIAAAVESSRSKPLPDKLRAINVAVNRAIAYTRDQDVYGRRDYWARPAETLTRGKGDCEDFAILKMAALKAAGVPAESMTLVVLRDRRRNLFHAVLAVATDRGQFVLDNLRDEVPRDTALGDYQALYSMRDGKSFIHGYPVGSRLAAGAPAAPGMAEPGEGVERRS